VIGRKIRDPNETVTFNTKDIGSIVSHGIAPSNVEACKITRLVGFKEAAAWSKTGSRMKEIRRQLEPQFTCQACGRRGAVVRPNFHWEEEAPRAKAAAAADPGLG
jgi:hypothetical protein